MTAHPILYSFRRCPYAMRARMALYMSGIACRLREVVLRDKPEDMIRISPKATVPVLQHADGTVIDESLEIMHWALGKNDPDCWLDADRADMDALIAANDGPFKHHLDRFKYSVRYEDADPEMHRRAAISELAPLETRLGQSPFLTGDALRLADIAIFPFVRQFANAGGLDGADMPHLRTWLQDRVTSPLFTSIMTKWPQWKSGDEEPLFGQER